MNPARLVSLLSPKSVDPRRDQTDASTSPSKWTIADVALGLAGLDDPYAAAARYRWAREESQLPLLERRLFAYAEELARRESWPANYYRLDGERVPFALRDLVRLALLEDHYQAILKSGAAMAAMLGVSEHLWRRRISPKYEAIRGELENWNGIAYAHVRRRLGD